LQGPRRLASSSASVTICYAGAAENDSQVSILFKFTLPEIMLLELTGSAEDSAYNVFDIQSFFNSVQSK
jgi:hypothetical protein